MDGYMTISQVSQRYQISPRMLRHYEKLGLIESTRKADYAYWRGTGWRQSAFWRSIRGTLTGT